MELLNASELAVLCDGVTYHPDHNSLLEALQARYPEAGIRLVAARGEWKRDDGRLFTADGAEVADSWREWVTAAYEECGQNAKQVWNTYRYKGLAVSEYRGETLYLATPYGDAPDAWQQLEIKAIREVSSRPLLLSDYWAEPDGLDDLLNPWFRHTDPHETVSPWRYEVTRLTNIRRYLRDLVVNHQERRRQDLPEQVHMELRSVNNGHDTMESMHFSFVDLYPDWQETPPSGIRFFQDWAACSAGQSGLRLCDHWVMRLQEGEDSGRRQVLDVIPIWADADGGLGLPRVAARNELSVYAVMDKLETFDREAGYPFAWYFYMLHGYRVETPVGLVIARGLREGRIGLPEHDADVLLRWADRPYGF